MKKFIAKMVILACFVFFISIVPVYVIDPFNVFHWNNIRNNGVEPNKNYIKTEYILHNPDLFNGFVFGSSRVGSIHVEKIPNMKIYNMTYSMGTPYEQYQTLKTFIENGIKIDIVYLGVDDFSYKEDPEKHNHQHLRASYQYLQNKENLISLYCDPTIILQSLPTVINEKNIEGFEAFYTYGWWADYDIKTEFTGVGETMPAVLTNPVKSNYYRLEQTIKDILDMKILCERNNIEFVVFTNPMYDSTYRNSIETAHYLDFIEKLGEITNFYNFSGLNDITKNSNNYIDESHYNAYVGDIILDVIVSKNIDYNLYEQGFGWYVTMENLADLIELLESQK